MIESEINKNFLIRFKENDFKTSQLIGAGRYHILVGKEIAHKHFKRVLEGGKDKYTFKIRKRLKIDFVAK